LDGTPTLSLLIRHVTGTATPFGAAAAISKLLNLSAKQFVDALGHITSLTGGTRGAFGTDTKTLHVGRGAQNGILAALLAQEEFETGHDIIAYWAKLVTPTINMDALSDRLGQKWAFLDNTFKPYPCGIVNHPLIDGGLEFRRRGISPGDIEKLHVKVNPQCVRLCDIRHPKTALEAIFSLYHASAVALLYGTAGKREYTDEVCNRSEVAEMRSKIEVTTDASMRDDETHMLLLLRNGKEEKVYIEHAKGSLANPLTQEEVQAKFIDQSRDALGLENCTRIVEVCDQLQNLDNIAQLLKLCQTK
jgi:aconitate decarboxylase